MPARDYTFAATDTAPALAARYYPAASPDTGALLVLAHGAGAGQASPFMRHYGDALSARGIAVVTFDFPYVTAGRRAPDRTARLEDAFRNAVRGAVAAAGPARRRLVIGGKSMGGRIATHLASRPDAWPPDLPPLDGVVALGYPLTPPGGRRAGDRVTHLRALSCAALIVQGTRDAFGGPDEVVAALGGAGAMPSVVVLPVPGGDHSFGVLKSSRLDQEAVHAGIQDAIARWIAAR